MLSPRSSTMSANAVAYLSCVVTSTYKPSWSAQYSCLYRYVMWELYIMCVITYWLNCPHVHSTGQHIVELQLLLCYHCHCSGHCVLSVWQLNIAHQRDSLDSVWWCHWCAIIVSACYRWQRCSHCKWIISWPLYHSRSITSGWLWLTVLWCALYYSPCVTSDNGSPPSVLSTLCHM